MTDQNIQPGRDFLLRDGDLSVRPLCDRAFDYVILSRWLQNPRVLEFFGGSDQKYSLEVVREKYSPKPTGQECLVPCLIEFLGRPIGFIEFTRLLPEDIKKYGYAEGDLVCRIDLFIGETDLWGYGLGRRALDIVTRHLFKAYSASRVIVDPQIDNIRAIRSYVAAGFRKVRLLPRHQHHEGRLVDCFLMEATPEQMQTP